MWFRVNIYKCFLDDVGVHTVSNLNGDKEVDIFLTWIKEKRKQVEQKNQPKTMRNYFDVRVDIYEQSLLVFRPTDNFTDAVIYYDTTKRIRQ